MNILESLKKMGLTKYESEAYLSIVKHQIVDAKTICKETTIPHGKIYETLNSLKNMSLIEIQQTRPKKFRAVKQSIAFENFYNKKEKQITEELNNTKELLNRIGEELSHNNKITNEENNFWKVAFKEDIHKMLMDSFDNADQEINMLASCIPLEFEFNKQIPEEKEELFSIIKKVKQTIKRGIELKIIKNRNINNPINNLIDQKSKNFLIENNLKIVEQKIPDLFVIIDNETIIMRIENPLQQNETLAMIKIWNPKLATQLNSKFRELWKISSKPKIIK